MAPSGFAPAISMTNTSLTTSTDMCDSARVSSDQGDGTREVFSGHSSTRDRGRPASTL